jgi:hypothetical protein
MGADTLRFTADIEWNGKEIARRCLQNRNLSVILSEIKDEKSLETFLLKYGEAVIEQIGTLSFLLSFSSSFFLFLDYH